jgi:hypothetical protein
VQTGFVIFYPQQARYSGEWLGRLLTLLCVTFAVQRFASELCCSLTYVSVPRIALFLLLSQSLSHTLTPST